MLCCAVLRHAVLVRASCLLTCVHAHTEEALCPADALEETQLKRLHMAREQYMDGLLCATGSD